MTAESPTELADAEERGLIAPGGTSRSPATRVRGAALIANHVARWAADDRTTDVASLTSALDALHPQERQGYAMLLALVAESEFVSSHQKTSEAFLVKEIAKAWPYLVLALRSDQRYFALDILIATRTATAAPYVLAAIRHPTTLEDPNLRTASLSSGYDDGRKRLAEGFVALGGQLAPADLDELSTWLSRDAGRGSIEVAARLLVRSANDDRVFEGYLRWFCAAHPYSVTALAKRRKEPRVKEVLCAAFALQESRSLKDGRHLAYSRDYGLLAAYLKKLGAPGAAEAYDRYRQHTRMVDNLLHPRDDDFDL